MSQPETQLKKSYVSLPTIKTVLGLWKSKVNQVFLLFFLFFVIIFLFLFILAQDCVDSRLRAGSCIALSKCPDIVEEFYDEARKTSYGIDFQTFVSNSLCGFDGTNFLVSSQYLLLFQFFFSIALSVFNFKYNRIIIRFYFSCYHHGQKCLNLIFFISLTKYNK